jgi:hypothetical protein
MPCPSSAGKGNAAVIPRVIINLNQPERVEEFFYAGWKNVATSPRFY